MQRTTRRRISREEYFHAVSSLPGKPGSGIHAFGQCNRFGIETLISESHSQTPSRLLTGRITVERNHDRPVMAGQYRPYLLGRELLTGLGNRTQASLFSAMYGCTRHSKGVKRPLHHEHATLGVHWNAKRAVEDGRLVIDRCSGRILVLGPADVADIAADKTDDGPACAPNGNQDSLPIEISQPLLAKPPMSKGGVD